MELRTVQIEAEIEHEKHTSLGSAVGGFGIVLVLISVSKIITYDMFFQGFVKVHVSTTKKTEMDSGTILDRFGCPNGANIGPKMASKRYRK